MSSIAKFNFLAQTRRKWRFFIHQAFEAPPPPVKGSSSEYSHKVWYDSAKVEWYGYAAVKKLYNTRT